LYLSAFDQINEMHDIGRITKKKKFSMKVTVDQANRSISAVNAGV